MRLGPRTLVLTHLKKAASQNLAACTRFWELKAQGRPAFERRLSLLESNDPLPEGVSIRRDRDALIYSAVGKIDDMTPPPHFIAAAEEFITPVDLGFAGPGERTFVLGGGNLDFCLAETFWSIVHWKLEQGEGAQIALPLPLTYHTPLVSDLLGYIKSANRYWGVLANKYSAGKTSGYKVTLDGKPLPSQVMGEPEVELHWFTGLDKFFASPFYPKS